MAERDYEVDGRTITVKADGRVLRSPVPDGVSPSMFRHVLAAIDRLYRDSGVIPTPVQVVDSWPGFTKADVKRIMATPELRSALALRGVEWDVRQGLTQLQLSALLSLSDPTDARGTKAKMADLGIPMSRYQAWMRNPIFSKALSEQAERNLGDSVQMAMNRLVANAESGDMAAINKIFEMSGRWNPQQQEVHNARQVLTIFLEALEKHASADVLRSVLDEVSQKTQMLAITQTVKGQ